MRKESKKLRKTFLIPILITLFIFFEIGIQPSMKRTPPNLLQMERVSDEPSSIPLKMDTTIDLPSLKKLSVSHPKISLTGNSALDTFANKTGGNGTSWDDAMIIENLSIDAGEDGPCIYIKNTDRFLIIRNCSLSGTTTQNRMAIELDTCKNIKILKCSMTNSWGYVSLVNCDDCVISKSNF